MLKISKPFYIILLCLFFMQSSYGISPDFYKQKKKKELLRIEREKGAELITQNRKEEIKRKEKRAKNYSTERQRILKRKEQREKLFDEDFVEKEQFKNRKIIQENEYAEKRRKKNEVSWKEQNLEYEIEVPALKKITNKTY